MLQLNHAIQLSADGTTLYASTSDEVYRWPYNATDGTVGNNETLVANMSNTDVSSSLPLRLSSSFLAMGLSPSNPCMTLMVIRIC